MESAARGRKKPTARFGSATRSVKRGTRRSPSQRRETLGEAQRTSRRSAMYNAPMCIICIDFDRGALRPAEARRALGEMRTTLDPDHVKDIEKKLEQAEKKPTTPSKP